MYKHYKCYLLHWWHHLCNIIFAPAVRVWPHKSDDTWFSSEVTQTNWRGNKTSEDMTSTTLAHAKLNICFWPPDMPSYIIHDWHQNLAAHWPGDRNRTNIRLGLLGSSDTRGFIMFIAHYSELNATIKRWIPCDTPMANIRLLPASVPNPAKLNLVRTRRITKA